MNQASSSLKDDYESEDDEDIVDFHNWDGSYQRSDGIEVELSAVRIATQGEALIEDEDMMPSEDRQHVPRSERVKSRRGAFKWLPVYFSNDVEHGSWYV